MKSNSLLTTSPIMQQQKTPKKSPRRTPNESKSPFANNNAPPTPNTLKPIYLDTKQIPEYIPEPPLETQFRNIGRSFEKIECFFNVDETKDNVSNSSSFNESNSINSDTLKEGTKEQFDIEFALTDFSKSLDKLINDIFQLYISASAIKQNSIPAFSSDAQTYFDSTAYKIDDQLKSINVLFMSINKLQFNVMESAVKSIQKPKILLGPLFKNFNSSIEKCHKNYITSLWGLAKLSIENEDIDVYDNFRQTFIAHLNSSFISLRKLSTGIVNSINEIIYDPQIEDQSLNDTNKDPNLEDQGEEILDYDALTIELQSNACNIYGTIINHFINEDFSLISPILKEFWTIDPKIKKYTEKENGDQENNDEDYIEDLSEDDGVKLTTSLYDARCELLKDMYEMLDSLRPRSYVVHEEEEENHEEELEEIIEEEMDEDQEARMYPLVHLIKVQLTKLCSSYFEEVKSLWLLSAPSKMDRPKCVPEFGSLLAKLMVIRVKSKDLTLKLKTISSLFRISVRIGDDKTAFALIKILEKLFNDRIQHLTSLRMNEIHFISTEIPQFFFQVGDYALDEEVGNELKGQLTEIYLKKSETIQTTSSLISEALLICQKAIFQFHRHLLQKKQKEKDVEKPEFEEEEEIFRDEEEEEDEDIEKKVSIFSELDVTFNDRTHEHLSNLKNYLNEIYANVLVATAGSPVRDGSDGASISAASTVSALSCASKVSARKARKNAQSKSTRKKIEERLNFSEKLQVLFIQESIARTYEELFASLQNLITAAIRNLDVDMAESFNKELRSMNTDHLNNLEEIRKIYVDNLDIKNTRNTEERMTSSQTVSNRIILKSLEECFKDALDQTLDNFQANLVDIEEDFRLQKESSDKEFNERFQQLQDNERDDSKIFEKNRMIKLNIEEQRKVAALNDREKLIKKLLNERRYDEAEKEKKILDAQKVKEKETRKKAMDDKYKVLRKQKSNVHNRNIQILTESHKAKEYKNVQEKQRKIEEQKKMLSSSIRSIQQRILLFGTRLMQNDQKVRKDLAIKFDKIAQNTMKERNMPNVMRPRH